MNEKLSTDGWFTRKAAILSPGVYRAELMAVSPGVGKGYGKNQTERDTLMFSFRDKANGAVINRTVTRTNSEKSQLVQLVRAMSGTKAPGPDTIADPEAFKDFILSMVGKSFLVQVTPSNDGRYNNLIACFPAPETP